VVLVGYWPLNESSGSTAYDHSGNENHGTINDGGDSTVPGANGILDQNAYSFDGSNDKVESQNNVPIGGSQERTLVFWAKADTLDVKQHPANWGQTSQNNAFGFWVDNSNNVYYYGHGLSDGHDYDVGLNLDTKWHMWTVTYDGSIVRTFRDEEETPNSKYSHTLDTSKTILHIGSRMDNTSYWNGKLSEVRIYDHPLTPAEIQYLYTASQRGRQATSRKSS
jgi:hypothetical protein